jgi:hypothetical protein
MLRRILRVYDRIDGPKACRSRLSQPSCATIHGRLTSASFLGGASQERDNRGGLPEFPRF